MSIHAAAMRCLDKAILLAQSADEDSLRYACLQLRMSIEHLFYQLLPSYREELPTDVFDQWQPRQILDAVIDCDPDATEDRQVWIQVTPDKPVTDLGKQTAVTKKLLRDHYHRLGSFMHAPLHGKPLVLDKLRATVADAINAVESYRGDRIIANMGSYIRFPCVRCNHPFKRRASAIPPDMKVRCLNSKCAAIHQLELNPDGSYRFMIPVVQGPCPSCGAEMTLDETDYRAGHEWQCPGCSNRFRLVQTLVPEPMEQS
jgi:DNA-directed RNA polymerase subunit RPC12/RpoP